MITRIQTDAKNLRTVDVLLREQGKEIVSSHIEVYDALVVLAEAGQHVVHTCPSLCNQKRSISYTICMNDKIVSTRRKELVIPR